MVGLAPWNRGRSEVMALHDMYLNPVYLSCLEMQ